jgi:hypothetical protein
VERHSGRKITAKVLPGCRGLHAVSPALAYVKSQVAMVSRLRWDGALYHQLGSPAPGNRGPKPSKENRQQGFQAWSNRSDTPWEDVEVDWYRGQRKKL